MVLNYPQKDNGMFIIRKDEMENIATMIFKEYAPKVLDHPQPINIISLAEDCLFLSIQYKHISYDNKVLGLTAFADVRVPCLDEMFRPTEISVPEGTIVINSGLLDRTQYTRKRYTIAHEVSHWILHRTYHSPINQKYQLRTANNNMVACRSADVECGRYELRTDHDWEEWQADSLAAAILMPFDTFRQTALRIIREYTGRNYLSANGYTFEYSQILESIAAAFMVSKKAAEIRLKQLGLIKSLSRASCF